MTLIRCIPGLLAEGKLTPDQAARATEIYGRRERFHKRSMGEAAAAAQASADTVKAIEVAAAQKKSQTLLQVTAQKRIVADMATFDGSPGRAARALFDHDGKAPYSNVEARRGAIVGAAHTKIADILETHRRNLVGEVRDKAGLGDIVRELYGEASGNIAAREMADAFARTAEGLRLRFNAAGGHIGKLDRWGLPQSHDSLKLRAAGYRSWRGFTLPLLDRARMIDHDSGLSLDDETLEALLADMFETVRTDGWASRAPGGAQGRRKLGNQRAEHRFLQFKNAAAWIAYDARFGGSGGAFDAMIGHIEGMARDIAHMEILGPNPAASVQWLQDALEKGVQLGDGADLDASRLAALAVGQLYQTTSGALNAPVHNRAARTFGSVRAVNVSQMLGSAVISAFTDVGFQAITRGFNGLPVTGALTGYLKQLNPFDAVDRRIALRLGLIAREAATMGSAQQRFLGESVGHEWSRRLADFTMRSTGLSAWTQAGRWAFGMEFLGHLADQVDVRFDALSPPLRSSLERYGFDAGDWDIIRSVDLYEHEGATFLRPEDIADMAGQWGPAKGRHLADRVLEMVLSETDYAVPAATVRSQAITTAARPGTLWGEISRNLFLFKSFGVSMLLTHGRRMMEQQGYNRALYGAGLFVTTTLLGALALQDKEITKGRDPLPMTGVDFWKRAIFQGGGFGIFGDFAVAGTSERSGSLAEAAGGPVVGSMGDAMRFASGNMNVADAAKRYTPVASSAWYGRLAYERLVIDELRRWSDDDPRAAFRRMKKRARRENGQRFWWEPGAGAPARPPDLGNIWAEEPE